jgi:hypothetical protein
MSLNNKYYYPTLVSMESALINCNKEKTFLTYHIQCTPEVTQDILSILKSLVYKYPYNLEIIFYNMNDILVSLNNERYSQATYYRILSPIIFDIDRIIHIDADTLVLKDLSEMYEYDLGDNYFLGILDMKSDGVDFLGVKSEKYINCGVISRADFNIIPDTLYDLYTHNKHLDGFYVNTYGDLFYIPFKMIKNGYDFVMNVDERTFLGIIKNCFVTEGLIKGFGMFVIYSLGIYVIIDVIYKHLLFINVNKDYDLLKNYGLNPKGIRRSSCLINFWNVLFAILGIIFGIIFVKNWYYNETKSISNVPFGANYPLSIIVSILAIVLLACISGLIFAWKAGRSNENSIE